MRFDGIAWILCGLGLLATMCGAKPIAELADFRAPVAHVAEKAPGFLWIEAEGFADYGHWRLDTQFTHKMGSAYLIAPGVGKSIGEAVTTIKVSTAGIWRAWVRTKDWLPEFSPGRFKLAVGGKASPVLGILKKAGWRWEDAGTFELAAGVTKVALVDVSGAFARCDAVLLTRELNYVPQDDLAGVQAARLRFSSQSDAIVQGAHYEVLVIGAGPAGMGAALASARNGARTGLVHDRPVLGGNASCELGIGTGGAAHSHRNARESGLNEEANLIRNRFDGSFSKSYQAQVDRTQGLTVHPNQRVMEVEKKGDKIVAVIARDTLRGVRTRYTADLFVDCTGDGWIGYFAGAEYMYGREARSQWNEAPAPEKADTLTMSGCLMGDNCLSYKYVRRSQPMPYTPPAWANVLPEGFTRRIRSPAPVWWIEHGGKTDDLADPEGARDELIRIVFAYWGWVKNASPQKDAAANLELEFVPYMNARREGFRLVGDLVQTANDALEGRMFEDRIAYGGWPLDTHDPEGIYNPTGDGYWKHHPEVPLYSISYRALYSKNIPNLFFAGRCQSVSHIALGSVRVEATLSTLGQAAGTAAALCTRHRLLPRALGETKIKELQQTLLKDDQYIPQMANEDPQDLARTQAAKVTATSTMTYAQRGREDLVLRLRPKRLWQKSGHPLDMARAAIVPRGETAQIDHVFLHVVSTNAQPTDLKVRLFESDAVEEDSIKGARPLAEAVVTVPAGKKGYVQTPALNAKPTGKYLWVVVHKAPGVQWTLLDKLQDGAARAWKGGAKWRIDRATEQYAMATSPALRYSVDARPENVIDGVSRTVGDALHLWASDPNEDLPQTLTLEFKQPVTARQVRLTFDSELTLRYTPKPLSALLVKDYVVEVCDGKTWHEVAQDADNYLRLRVHDFEPRQITAVRVTVRGTHGAPSARIFELRVY